jgi:hypothetical protein
MGRTVPSFRNVLEREKQEWKPYRNALDKSDRKSFDEMWGIPRLYVSACSNSVQLVPFHPIAISILFHHYKELVECRKQTEQMNRISRTIDNVREDLQNDMGEDQDQEEEEYQVRRQQQRPMMTLFDFE